MQFLSVMHTSEKSCVTKFSSRIKSHLLVLHFHKEFSGMSLPLVIFLLWERGPYLRWLYLQVTSRKKVRSWCEDRSYYSSNETRLKLNYTLY